MVLRNASFFESRGVAQWFGKARELDPSIFHFQVGACVRSEEGSISKCSPAFHVGLRSAQLAAQEARSVRCIEDLGTPPFPASCQASQCGNHTRKYLVQDGMGPCPLDLSLIHI